MGESERMAKQEIDDQSSSLTQTFEWAVLA